MANEGRKRTLIDTKGRLEKQGIDINRDMERKATELNKLSIEYNKQNTTDSRRKSIVSKITMLEKDLVNLRAKLEKNNKDYNKAHVELIKLS